MATHMLLAVLIGFLLAPAATLIYPTLRQSIGWLVPLIPLGLLLYFASFIQRIEDGEIITESYEWVPSLGVNLTFRLDGLSLLFALIITGMGTLVFLYAGGYLKNHPQLGRFYTYILVFMASMLGLVLSDNIISVFVFWELTSISSYWLISFYHDREESREAARTALLVTGSAGLVLLAGMVLLGILANTWEISTMLPLHETIQDDPLYVAALVLIVIGAFAKSAQFPFHFWLPMAMEAPAPVSAYLHSATMVKAGIYLLARLHPILGGTDEWHFIVILGGGITMLLGGYMAWQQTDIKRILAYTTISALGIMVFLLGIGTGMAVKAALLFVVVHALYKGAFFLIGGSIDHETGTRDITRLGGLRTAMPITAGAAAIAGLSMAGIPPLLGFVGKEVIYEATQHSEDLIFPAALLTLVAVVGNVFNVTVAGMAAIRPFFGEHIKTAKHAHEAPLSMWMGPVILGGLGLAFGLFSGQLLQPLLAHAVENVYGKPYEVELKLWHGFNSSLLLSAITVAAGATLYVYLERLRPIFVLYDVGEKVGTSRLYKETMAGTLFIADWQNKIIFEQFRLRHYIRIILGTFVLLVMWVLVTRAELLESLATPKVRVHELVIMILIVTAAIAVVRARSRLFAVAALGVVGLGNSLLFLLFGAPDLAMTQLAIEVLTVILFVFILYRLPRFQLLSTRNQRQRDAGIATAIGALMTLLVLLITAIPLESRLTPYFAENSYLLAKGHNVVNVILVDFRGFDTMGEITVLSLAAIGVFALLNLNLNKAAPVAPPEVEPQEMD
jgi:multicomponent Na+:H+ antiporter subunit A